MFYRLTVLALLAGLLSGCGVAGGKKYGTSPDTQLVPDAVLPAPTQADQPEAGAYALGPFDKVTISVFGMPEMTQADIQIDAGGNISVPLIGLVQAAGKTAPEVSKEIEQRMRQAYVRDPKVALNVTETMSQNISVGGEVKRPGIYPIIGRMTLLSALSRAEGFSEVASVDDVVIFRTVGGQRYAAIYNVGAIRRGNYPDPQVFAHDTVVVGDSAGRRLFRDLLQVIPLITTPVVVALQR